jgi:hypothetical protein
MRPKSNRGDIKSPLLLTVGCSQLKRLASRAPALTWLLTFIDAKFLSVKFR